MVTQVGGIGKKYLTSRTTCLIVRRMALNPYDLVNSMLDGQLGGILIGYRQTLTIDQTVTALSRDHHIDVSRETVRRWQVRAEAEAERAA